MDESVLVFPTPLLQKLGYFHGFTNQIENYVGTILDPRNLSYMPRVRAEDDPTFKQLIPYAVFQCCDSVFVYERSKKGSETRLHNLLSLGVGGHISTEDGERGELAYQAGFARELAEEVQIDSPYTDRIVGLVNDDSTPVGQVHLGVVHLLELQEPKVTPRDPALSSARFRPIEEIRAARSQFETWSAFVIDNLLPAP